MVIHYTIQILLFSYNTLVLPYTCQLYYIPANWEELQSDWTPIKSSFFTLTHGQKFLRMRLGIQSDLTSIKSSV